MKRNILLASASLAVIAIGAFASPSAGDHVRIAPPEHASGPVVVAPVTVTAETPVMVTPGTVLVPGTPAAVVMPPSGSTTVATIPATTVRVEQIRAHQVRATTIYANRIEADQVQGVVVHQANTVRVADAQQGELVGPEVAATVIHADAIAANSVVADRIHVRELELSPSRFAIRPLAGGTLVRRQSP